MSLRRAREFSLLSALFLTNLACSHTPDRRLEELFRTNRKDFEKLVGLITADGRIRLIDRDYIGLKSGPAIALFREPAAYRQAFTEMQWKEYQALFKKLELRAGVKVTPTGQIYLGVDAVSLWNGDSEKGLLYSPGQPMKEYERTTDGHRLSDPKVRSIYRKVAPNWYIYLFFD